MAVTCPHCQHRASPSQPKPGRYRVRCTRCGQSFGLVIPDEDGAAWKVRSFGDTRIPELPNGSTTHRTVRRVPALTDAGRVGFDLPPPRVPDPGAETASRAVETPKPPKTKPNIVVQAGSIPDGVDDPDPPEQLPGYHIEATLGHGGMGSVYLARQLSLDRPVALKVMSKQWANDPVFVARFTREAFAAALLNHPNVVQIYDIGEAGGSRFFSMEYVPGRSLADLVKTDGKVDPETAVGYVLQAARGLKHAHDRAMIHRDVKPDNLLLNDQGIVKVADLGLVKTPDTPREQERPRQPSSGLHTLPTNMTGVRMALGTPAYMAPEQCRDAAAVDHRADIYSLGCTLYVLVTGRPPFDGTTAVELMTKHAYEPLVPPEAIVTRVPKELSAIIQRMMAKEAGERFANMGEVIRTLEQWLGVHHAGTFSPRDEQIDQVERFVKSFTGAPSAVLRGRLVAGAASVCLLAAVLLMFFGRLGGAFGLAGMVLHAAAAYFIVNGLTRKTYLFRRARQFALGLSVGDCVVAAAGAGLFAVLLWVLGLFWLWTSFGLAGVGLALALRFGLDRRIEAERRESLDGCERLLRRMRLSGVDEEDLRQFVAKYAGRDWEEFYEALFGYEAKLSARAVLLRGGSAGVREKFAGWREPVIALIDRVEKARRESRERRLLEQVEQARLVAAGLTERAARDRAAEAAADLMKQAKAIRHADVKRRTVGPAAVTAIGMPNLGHLAQTAAQPNPLDFGHSPRRERAEGIVGLFVGPHVRAVLAAVLLAGCGLWVYQSGLLVNFYLATRTTHAAGTTFQPVSLRPLELDGLPASWTAWCDGVNVGWGGVLLLASLFFRGNRSALLVLLGTAITVLGHRFGIRTVEPIQEHHVSLLLGTVLALVGYRLGRRV